MKLIIIILILALSSIILFAEPINDGIVQANNTNVQVKDTIRSDGKIIAVIDTNMITRFNNVHDFDTTMTFQYIIDYINKHSFGEWYYKTSYK